MALKVMKLAMAAIGPEQKVNSHPAHGPLSFKRLNQIREILRRAAAQSDGGHLGYAMADAVKVIDEVLEFRISNNKSAAYAPIAYLRLMVALDLKIAHELLERRKATGSIN
ncbi:hypothetical protein [Citrobacter freundii]|uniref:Uncharacterized protein n=1 Tax=Citrobacter freundii TaxID=546 RepID=A0A7G2ISC8_CITFR|nr:hypothetical protein [Citrobacter freundii]